MSGLFKVASNAEPLMQLRRTSYSSAMATATGRVFLLSLMRNVIICPSQSDLRNVESMLAACEFFWPLSPGAMLAVLESETSQGVGSDFWYYRAHGLKTST